MSDERTIALVTGASRGIGKAVAHKLAADGMFVVGTATRPEGAAAVADSLGGGGTGVVLRLEDESVVAEAVAEIQLRYGAPLVLVNNAGVTRDNLLLRMSPQQWSDVLDANLTGIYRLTRPLLRGMMRARWGRIVNLSSVCTNDDQRRYGPQACRRRDQRIGQGPPRYESPGVRSCGTPPRFREVEPAQTLAARTPGDGPAGPLSACRARSVRRALQRRL